MKRSIYALLTLILAAGCILLISMGRAEKLDTKKITVGGTEIIVEIADDTESRRTGLMNRKSMPEDHGMLFIFESDQKLSFWMKSYNFV